MIRITDEALEEATNEFTEHRLCDSRGYPKQWFQAGAKFAETEILNQLRLLISNNEDDLDRGKGKYLLEQFIEGL